MQHKNLKLENVELKLDDTGRKFSGYASVFGGVDSYGDTIIPGAYKSTLESRSRPIQLRWNHYGDIIGKWTSLKEDEKGLFVEGELTPGHSKAEDAYALLKHGAVTGLSIGYRVVKGVENETGGKDLHEIDLIEISIVETPADNNAHVNDVKAAFESATSFKEIERLLRDAKGFSRSEAVALVACVKALSLSDSEAKQAPADIAALFQQKLHESKLTRGKS